jgi:hypothetical protein
MSEVFNLSSEGADALKLEVSDLAPGQEVKIQNAARVISRAYVDYYGEYMTSQAIEKASETPKRIIVVAEEKYQDFRQQWPGKKSKIEGFPVAFYRRKGDLIIINGGYLKAFGFLEKKSLELFDSLLAHEAAHRFQNHKATRMFHECGSSYYAREVLKHLGKRQISSELDFQRANFYQMLIDKLGETVHHFFYGTHKSDKEKYQIYGLMDDYREELLKLFPKAAEARRKRD